MFKENVIMQYIINKPTLWSVMRRGQGGLIPKYVYRSW